MRRISPRSVEPWPKMAKYFRTPCFSRPSTSASESETSTMLPIAPAFERLATPPAAAMARARAAIHCACVSGRTGQHGMRSLSQGRNHGLRALRFVGESLAVAECPSDALYAQQQADGGRKHDDRGLVGEGRSNCRPTSSAPAGNFPPAGRPAPARAAAAPSHSRICAGNSRPSPAMAITQISKALKSTL